MPSVLSKELAARLLGSEWSFGYNCYEVGHTWTPSCTHAALEVSLAAALKVVPLYAALYTFSQVAVQQRLDAGASWDTAKSICRSSFFIFFHAYNGSMMGCALRRGFGRFYYRVLVCAPALLSSYLSLVIEKPARRQALAFYLLNLASEIVFRMLVTKGYVKPLWAGETLVFAVSLGAWYHLLKSNGFGHDPVSAAVKVLIGRDEARSRSRRPLSHSRTPPIVSPEPPRAIESPGPVSVSKHSRLLTSVLSSKPFEIIQQYQRICVERIHELAQTKLGGRHQCCPHQEDTCIHYVLRPLASRFLAGHLIQSVLKLASKPAQLIQQPRVSISKSFTSWTSVRFGLFLASLVSSGRLTSCLLRRYSDSNEPNWHGAVSGFVAGLSMLWAPKSSISMYVMWKAVEQYYLLAHRQGKVSHFNFQILTIYSISAATILYTFALEPKFVRPSYMKFLDNLSDHRLHQLNRMVLDVFGTGSSIGYEDYFPDLDPKYMSNQFKELVFNWMIQPYE